MTAFNTYGDTEIRKNRKKTEGRGEVEGPKSEFVYNSVSEAVSELSQALTVPRPVQDLNIPPDGFQESAPKFSDPLGG